MADLPILATFFAFSAGALGLLGSMFLMGFTKVNPSADRWLGAFCLILACTFTQLFLEAFKLDASGWSLLLELPRWAMLPCLYMAVNCYVAPSLSPQNRLLHFVPFLLFLLFSLVYLIPALTNPEAYVPSLPAWIRFIVRYFFLGQMMYYWMSCFALLRRHQTNLLFLSSFTENIDLKWLSYLLASGLMLIGIRLLSLFVTEVTAFSPVLYFAGIILLAYSSLTQKSIYVTESFLTVEKDEIEATKETHERLTPAQVGKLQRIILRKTQDEKLYLDPQLTLSALALKTGITTHELSYVLNKGLSKNFYQFINELRVQEAKVLLLSDDLKHIDLLGVALKAGFNSKTTFYTTFKKATHLTPKEYIKAHMKTT